MGLCTQAGTVVCVAAPTCCHVYCRLCHLLRHTEPPDLFMVSTFLALVHKRQVGRAAVSLPVAELRSEVTSVYYSLHFCLPAGVTTLIVLNTTATWIAKEPAR